MIGLYEIDDIRANTIVVFIKDALIRMNLTMSSCRGQCYDGASNMSGSRSGVAKQLQDNEPHALFMHCCGHALKLADSDSIKKCKAGTALNMKMLNSTVILLTGAEGCIRSCF